MDRAEKAGVAGMIRKWVFIYLQTVNVELMKEVKETVNCDLNKHE